MTEKSQAQRDAAPSAPPPDGWDEDYIQGAALWRRWRATAPMGTKARVDPLTLAAWADGLLSPAEAQQVEAALARDPAALDLALAARAAALATSKDPIPAAPLGLIKALRALSPSRLALAGRAIGWAAALGGLLAIGISGYDMGMSYADATSSDGVIALASWDVGHGVDP